MATDVSSVVNHFPEAQNGFSTTLSGTITGGATTVGLTSVGSYTNGKPVVLVVDPTDASKKQTFTGTVDTSGTQITNVKWTAGTNQSHSAGATVVDYFTATVVDMICKGILVEHGQDGKHDAVTADSVVIADGGNLEVDHILEAATGHGVTIDGFAVKDSAPKNWDGWITPDETWTYASASTFTVAGDQTAKYTAGTRLKFTQTTVKYAVVISSAYTSSTLVTIAVNTDYTIANAAITDNYYSYAANPQGYPNSFAYTTTVTCPSGTAPTYTTNTGRFSIVGNRVSGSTVLSNSSGGTAGASANPIIVTTPTTVANSSTGQYTIGHGKSYELGGTMGMFSATYASATTAYLASYNFTNVLGDDQSSASRYIHINWDYFI